MPTTSRAPRRSLGAFVLLLTWLSAPAALAQTWSAPDGGGYRYAEVAFTYDDIAAVAVTRVSGCGGCGASVPLPFSFEHYGVAYSTAYVSSNGYLTFDPSDLGDNSADPPPSTVLPNAIVAGFWSDLDMRTTGSVRTAVLGTAPERRLVADWVGVCRFPNDCSPSLNFQIVLFEGSNDVEIRLADASTNVISHAIGQENADGTVGTQIAYGAGSYTERAWRLRDDPDGDGIASALDNCPFFANPDQSDADSDGVGDGCLGDADGDGVGDDVDNCLVQANPDQGDLDEDGIGDVCDPSPDGDLVEQGSDNCPQEANPDQVDSDGDGVGDACEILLRIDDVVHDRGYLAAAVTMQALDGRPLSGTVELAGEEPIEALTLTWLATCGAATDTFEVLLNGTRVATPIANATAACGCGNNAASVAVPVEDVNAVLRPGNNTFTFVKPQSALPMAWAYADVTRSGVTQRAVIFDEGAPSDLAIENICLHAQTSDSRLSTATLGPAVPVLSEAWDGALPCSVALGDLPAGRYALAVTATDGTLATPDQHSALVTIDGEHTLTLNHAAPEASAGGPYAGDEGNPVALDASGSVVDGTGSYAWDLDGDGAYDDADEASVGYSWVQEGNYSVAVQVTDACGLVATAAALVEIENVVPVADDDAYQLDEDTLLDVAAAMGLLANDGEPGDDTLTAVLVSGPASGTLTLNDDGSFTYQPDADANGDVTFTYAAFDGIDTSSAATVTLTIAPVNDAPVFTAPTPSAPLAVTEGDVVELTLHAEDVDGDTLRYGSDDLPPGATLDAPSGALTWTPASADVGTRSFTVYASDGTLQDTRTITFEVSARDDDDNCVPVENTDQADQDGDGSGDPCDGEPGEGEGEGEAPATGCACSGSDVNGATSALLGLAALLLLRRRRG